MGGHISKKVAGKYEPAMWRWYVVPNEDGVLQEMYSLAEHDEIVNCILPFSYKQLPAWYSEVERGFERREEYGYPPVGPLDRDNWRKFKDKLGRKIRLVFPGIEDRSSIAEDYNHHITTWAVVLRFLYFMWNRAMAVDDFALLVNTFDDDWKHFEGDLVETGEPKRPALALDVAMKWLRYTCPIYKCPMAAGMSYEICSSCTPPRGFQHLWAAESVADPYKKEREEAFRRWKDDKDHPERKSDTRMTMNHYLKTVAPAHLRKPEAAKASARSHEEFYRALVLKQGLIRSHPEIRVN